MIFSENRYPSPIGSGTGFFRIMLTFCRSLSRRSRSSPRVSFASKGRRRGPTNGHDRSDDRQSARHAVRHAQSVRRVGHHGDHRAVWPLRACRSRSRPGRRHQVLRRATRLPSSAPRISGCVSQPFHFLFEFCMEETPHRMPAAASEQETDSPNLPPRVVLNSRCRKSDPSVRAFSPR